MMESSRSLRLILHIAGWILFFGLMVAFTASAPGASQGLHRIFTQPFLLFLGVYLFLFYLNAEILIPRFYLQKQHFVYFLSISILLIVVIYVKPFDRLLHNEQPGIIRNFPDGPPPRLQFDIVSVILFIMVWLVGMALQIAQQWRYTEQRVARAETDKARAELSFLKAQINPHFLFNTLNNIYALAVAKNEQTPHAIMRLSNIMRYVTDEIGEDLVPIADEVNCVKDYIDLQRMRLSNKVKLDYTVTGDLAGKYIPPLVLMTFVENVFKYGISNHEDSPIEISIRAEVDNVQFYSRNRIFESVHESEREGIGILNTMRRLDHLYGEEYSLNITDKNGFYAVELTVPMK
jgi:hypothetical protein